RPAGAYRVEHAEQLLAQRYDIEEIVEDGAQLLLGTDLRQAFVVSLAIGRFKTQCGIHHKARDVQASRPAVDLLTGNFRQARHRRRGLEGRLLNRYGQHRAEVLIGRPDIQGAEGRLYIRSPAVAVGYFGGHQTHDPGAYLLWMGLRYLRVLGAAGHSQQCGEQQQARSEEHTSE